MVEATEPAGGGGVATDAGIIRGRALVTKSCNEAGSGSGYRPMCARWRSTADRSNRLNHLLQKGGRIGAEGILSARVSYAWRQALRMFAVPRYSW